jgi:flagellar M-ring protein FliF
MTMITGFKAASPGRQLVLVAAAAALICALLAAVYMTLLRTNYEPLFTGLRSADAATIVAELDKGKVPYRLEKDGTTILVPAERVAATRLDIMGRDLPLKGAVGFELFNKSDMGLTEFAQKINYQRALQGELARTIMTMESVDTARIHLTLTERTIFRDDQVPPKASVTVLPRPGHRLTNATVRGIQRLVAASVPELDLANVVVLGEDGQVMSGDGPIESGSLSPRLREKQDAEQHYASEITRAIEKVYPAADIEVTVWAAPVPRLEGEAAAAAAAAGSPGGWTPDSRTFRLRVAIASEEALDTVMRDEIVALASEVIGADPALGDVVTVSVTGENAVGGEWADASGPARKPVVAPAPVSEPVSLFGSLSLWAGLALLLLVAGLFATRRRDPQPRGLSEQQRTDLAGRFKILLEQGDKDAVRQP